MSDMCPKPIQVEGTPYRIRAYTPEDYNALRRINCNTGWLGEPIDSPGGPWNDRPSWADVYIEPFVGPKNKNAQPDMALVVEKDDPEKGLIQVGYLVSATDSKKLTQPPLVIAKHALRRGIATHPGTPTTQFIWQAMREGAYDILPRPGRTGIKIGAGYDPECPAQLEVDLAEGRRKGIGSLLVKLCLDELQRRGVPGCHLQTIEQNIPAVRCFERAGFKVRGKPFRLPGMRSPSGGSLNLLNMSIKLDSEQAA